MEITSQQGCHVMAKPTGSHCNLQCEYCFYLEKEQLYPQRQHHVMDDATLEQYIRQHIAAQPGDVAEFSWQGGEPTLAGLAFYQRAVMLQQKYCHGKIVQNTFQTNGLLIDDSWCQFFKRYNWLIGISLDGPAEVHDYYRHGRRGSASHHKVIRAIELLKKYQIEFNLLTVVNNINVTQPEKLYRYLKQLGTPHLQFIPLVERTTSDVITLVSPENKCPGNITTWSVDAEKYGDFLIAIFNIWRKEDIGRVYIQLFESLLGRWCGHPAQLCTFSETCGHAFALEANGDVYQCDHYVWPEYKIGNIHQQTIEKMNGSLAVQQFAEAKKSSLSADCRQCSWLPLCHGGCPKHRFTLSSQGKPEQNYFCQAYQRFFTHSAPYMRIMRDLIRMRRSPAELMRIA